MTPARAPVLFLIVAVMAIGSIAMWLVVPVAWLYLGSRLQEGSDPQFGPYLLIIVGIPTSMILIGKVLGMLDRTYGRVAGRVDKRHQRPWERSLRGERHSTREATVLDRVMIFSVGVALFCFAVWFFAFAGSSLPGA